MKPLYLLKSPEEISLLAQELSSQALIAVDTEFIRETSFYPGIEIIQISSKENSWLIDARFFKQNHLPGPNGGYDTSIKPLLDVMVDPKVLKIFHAAQGDQECLYTSFGVLATPILDTAIAASLCGFGEGVGLARLLKNVLSVHLNKGHTRTNWAARPLSQSLLEYAQADVQFLIPLATELLSRLEKLGRKEWALTLSSRWENPQIFEYQIPEHGLKIARSSRLDRFQFQVLLELIRWREKRVRELNLPRKWLADDSVLLDLVLAKPKDLEQLSSFRGLNKSEIKKSGLEILAAIHSPKEVTAMESAQLRFQDPPSIKETQTLELVRCYLNLLADQIQISSKHLYAPTGLLSLIRNPPRTLADLSETKLLTLEAQSLIGTELLNFVNGNIGLRIGPSGIELISAPDSHEPKSP